MIDLAPFCCLSDERYRAPFSQGDYSYATDGAIIVRVKRRDNVPAGMLVPVWDLAKTFAMAEAAKHWPLDLATCEKRQVGAEDVRCRLGVAWFSEDYLQIVAELPSVEVASAGEAEPLSFRFAGGIGLLMPTLPPSAERAP